MAEKQNPDLRVALETVQEADLDVKLAKTAFLPTLTVDTDYGIEANCFALNCTRAPASRKWESSQPWLFPYRGLDRAGLGLGDVAEQAASGGIQAGVGQSALSWSSGRT